LNFCISSLFLQDWCWPVWALWTMGILGDS
jgi:hypothetical protein